MAQPPDLGLAEACRERYQAEFWADVAAGRRTPFLVPLHLLGLLVVPFYLAIPHRDRPWLYRARWPLVAGIVAFNACMLRSVSSPNLGMAYVAGMLPAYVTISALALLVWTRPQWDAKRVERRRRRRGGGEKGPEQNAASGEDGKDGAARDDEFEYYWQEFPASESFGTRLDWASDISSSMRMTGWNWAISCLPPYRPPGPPPPPDLRPGGGGGGGDDTTRQGYTRPPLYGGNSHRLLWLRRRLLFGIVPAYLAVDLCATLLSADPWGALGPESDGDRGALPPLPPHLAGLSPLALRVRRTILGFVGIWAALQLALNAGALCLAFLCPPVLGFRAHLWHLPSVTGSFTQVLDHGLAGFWGAWWHQGLKSFRFGFTAPARWLERRGHLRPRSLAARLAGAALAFAQSALLHAAGSRAATPAHTRPLAGPALFFAVAGLGTVLQAVLEEAVKVEEAQEEAREEEAEEAKEPRQAVLLRRAVNLAFVVLWLGAAAPLLLDDFARAGLFLVELAPLSPARALLRAAAAAADGPLGGLLGSNKLLGGGLLSLSLPPAGEVPDLRVWRLSGYALPRWYVGRRWWEVGLAL
ncbi:hypothetical protein GGR56DRAFT_686156 [Xylariaceae sp. FL0804]|nr:hypothetical protein GGR56DRAFT_686156 [Xylariaceae sp. FL0804]